MTLEGLHHFYQFILFFLAVLDLLREGAVQFDVIGGQVLEQIKRIQRASKMIDRYLAVHFGQTRRELVSVLDI